MLLKKHVRLILFFMCFSIVGCGDSNSGHTDSIRNQEKIAHKNTSVSPPDGFTGVWKTYDEKSGRKILEAHYVNGKRDGEAIMWYVETGNIMSRHHYKSGVLSGAAIKYRKYNVDEVIVSGEYKNGIPWDGDFLAASKDTVDMNLYVKDSDEKYFVMAFKNGQLREKKIVP